MLAKKKGTKSKWAHKWAEMLHHPCILGGPQRNGDKIRIGGAHKWAKMLHHPCILGDPQREGGQNQNWWGPQVGRNATSPLHSRGSPTKGTKSKWAHKWAEMLHHPCILGDPQREGGQNQNWWGPQVSGNATSPLHSRGSPMKGEQNQNWMPNPCLLGGPQVGGNATSPLHSRGSPKKWGQNQNWMPNPCLLVGPQAGGNATSTLHSGGSPTKGTKSK